MINTNQCYPDTSGAAFTYLVCNNENHLNFFFQNQYLALFSI